MVDVLYQRASLVERAVALLLDVALVLQVRVALGLLGLSVPAGLILVAYFGCFDGIVGTTAGKWALDLEVVDASGEPPGLLRGFLRVALLPLNLFFFRFVHDLFTGTAVVKR